MAFAAFGSSAAPVEQAPRRRSWVALVLLLPGLAYLALFFLTPFVSLILTSLQTPVEFGDVGQFQQAFKIENYAIVVEQYWPHFLRAFGYALAATFFALVISYPLAYFIGVKARRWPLIQALMLTLVIAPFFISFLLRTLAWKALMSDETPLVQALKALSIIPNDGHLTGTAFSVIFGLTYNFIPFMTLPLYTTLERLDTRYLEAGSDQSGKNSPTGHAGTGSLLSRHPPNRHFLGSRRNRLSEKARRRRTEAAGSSEHPGNDFPGSMNP